MTSACGSSNRERRNRFVAYPTRFFCDEVFLPPPVGQRPMAARGGHERGRWSGSASRNAAPGRTKHVSRGRRRRSSTRAPKVGRAQLHDGHQRFSPRVKTRRNRRKQNSIFIKEPTHAQRLSHLPRYPFHPNRVLPLSHRLGCCRPLPPVSSSRRAPDASGAKSLTRLALSVVSRLDNDGVSARPDAKVPALHAADLLDFQHIILARLGELVPDAHVRDVLLPAGH